MTTKYFAELNHTRTFRTQGRLEPGIYQIKDDQAVGVWYAAERIWEVRDDGSAVWQKHRQHHGCRLNDEEMKELLLIQLQVKKVL